MSRTPGHLKFSGEVRVRAVVLKGYDAAERRAALGYSRHFKMVTLNLFTAAGNRSTVIFPHSAGKWAVVQACEADMKLLDTYGFIALVDARTEKGKE